MIQMNLLTWIKCQRIQVKPPTTEQLKKRWERKLNKAGLPLVLPMHTDKPKTPKIMQPWKNPCIHDFDNGHSTTEDQELRDGSDRNPEEILMAKETLINDYYGHHLGYGTVSDYLARELNTDADWLFGEIAPTTTNLKETHRWVKHLVEGTSQESK